MDTRLLAGAFEVLVDDSREARFARRISHSVEKRYRQKVLLQFLSATAGPFDAETVLRSQRVAKIRPQDHGKGNSEDGGDLGSKSQSGFVLPSAAAFWLWRRTAKRSKMKTSVVARVLARKNNQLLSLGWSALQKFSMRSQFEFCMAKSQDSLRALKFLKYRMQQSSSLSALRQSN